MLWSPGHNPLTPEFATPKVWPEPVLGFCPISMRPIALSLAFFALGFSAFIWGADFPPADHSEAGDPLRLKPITVKAVPLGSFGFSVRVKWSVETARVEKIIIDEVLPDSPADQAGIGVSTTIEKIDGRPVREFTATFDSGSDLNKALINRKPGDRITLEVLPVGAARPRIVTLVERGAESQRAHAHPGAVAN